jgi:hypothetical protein
MSYWIRVERVATCVSDLNWEEMFFSFPLFSKMLALLFTLFYSWFLLDFYDKQMLKFVKDFLSNCWDDYASFVLCLCVVLFIDLHISNHPWICEWNQVDHGIWSFKLLLNSISKYYIENFCINIHKVNWSIIFFCVCILIKFCIKAILTP